MTGPEYADVTATVPYDRQTLVYFAGSGRVVFMDDDAEPPADTFRPVERAVLVARLRTLADLIEQS